MSKNVTSSAIETAINPAVRLALRLAAARAFDVRRVCPGARGDGMRATVTDVSWSCKKAPDARPCSSASRGDGGVSSQTSGGWSAEGAVLERGPVPVRGPERQNAWRYDGPHAGRGADDPDPPLDPAGRPADPRADRAPGRREGLSRGLPVPGRRTDRAPARSAGARHGKAPNSARVVDCDRLPQLCRRVGRRLHRHRRDRRRPDAVGSEPGRRLPYERERTASADRIRAGRRPVTALARHASPGADRHPRAGPGPGRERPGTGRGEVHDRGDRLPARRGDLDLPARVQPRPDPRRVDLHAPRHGPPEARGGPTLSADARQAGARRPDGVRPWPATSAARCSCR